MQFENNVKRYTKCIKTLNLESGFRTGILGHLSRNK